MRLDEKVIGEFAVMVTIIRKNKRLIAPLPVDLFVEHYLMGNVIKKGFIIHGVYNTNSYK